MDCILTFDVGTTAVKASLFDTKLKLVSMTNVEYKLITQDNDIIEFPADGYWEAVKQSAEELEMENINVIAIAVTTQGETLIPVDKNGEALCNAIVWLDNRAKKEASYIESVCPQNLFYRHTGITACTGMCPISKILWIKNNQYEIYKQTYKFLLLEDYLIMRLTGKYASEKSLMSTTGYFDLETDDIYYPILDLLQLNADMLPTALECGTVVGNLTSNAASELKLTTGAVVVTSAMDQVCGALGAGNYTKGTITETTGTALCIGSTVDTFAQTKSNNIPIYRHFQKNSFLAISICMTAGILLKWFKDNFCEQEIEEAKKNNMSVYSIIDELAKTSKPLSNGLTVLPYFSGVMQPENNADAKGVFFGVDLNTSKADFANAILEAVAYMLRENIELIEYELQFSAKEIRSLGGGSKSKLWNKIKANINQVPIVTLKNSETTSLGAAALCAVALGKSKSVGLALASINAQACTNIPDESCKSMYDEGYKKYKNLYSALKTMF